MVLAASMACVLFAGCGGDGETDGPVSSLVSSPTEVSAERVGATSVKIVWTDNSDNEIEFAVWARAAADATDRRLAGTVGPDITEFTVADGLTEGESYFFGVQGKGSKEEFDSRIVYTSGPVNLTPTDELPSVSIIGEPTATTACIAVSYNLAGNASGDRYGLCRSAEGTPTIADEVQYGPGLSSGGETIMQVVPNALLDYDKTYKIRAFITSPLGTYYSAEKSAKLLTAPEAITMQWTRLENNSLPSDIELYETDSPLDGRKFHAWYAVTDVKGNVEMRVDVVSPAAYLDDQFDDDCYVLVNAGYMYNGRHTGLAVVDGVTSPGTVYDVLTTGSDTGTRYPVTRGVMGVDAAGVPDVCWTGSTSSPNVAYYYDRPLPTVVGEAKYKTVSSDNPVSAMSWTPLNAVSAGPVLLFDGKIPFDFTLTSKGAGFLLTNYEVIPNDIFGNSDVIPDRTAVGYLADGRVVLFVCDGRIADGPQGADMLELARIMKGLGCVEALNLDGGGSTGIVVGGRFLNDQKHGKRAIASTIGFYKK